MKNYTFSCNCLHLIKICLCCFLEKHLHSNNLSIIAMISSLGKSELFPAFFSCSSNFYLKQSSSETDDKNIVEIPEAIMASNLGNSIIDLSLLLLRPCCLI